MQKCNIEVLLFLCPVHLLRPKLLNVFKKILNVVNNFWTCSKFFGRVQKIWMWCKITRNGKNLKKKICSKYLNVAKSFFTWLRFFNRTKIFWTEQINRVLDLWCPKLELHIVSWKFEWIFNKFSRIPNSKFGTFSLPWCLGQNMPRGKCNPHSSLETRRFKKRHFEKSCFPCSVHQKLD